MNNEDSDLKTFIRRIDEGAARLNPGLSAIAIVLMTLVTAEAATRIASLGAEELATQAVQLPIDPTALLPNDVPPYY
jgi:hypothetical protein